MQTLRSRAAQAQSSCRGRICLHTTNTIVRRSTTAAPTRTVSVADLFTACYTTILGTAVVLDHKKKATERAKLDEKLEKAKATLDTLRSSGEPLCQHDESSVGKERHTADTINRLDAAIPARSRSGPQDADHILEDLNFLCDKLHPSLSQRPWMQDKLDWISVESAILAEELSGEHPLREASSDRELQLGTSAIQYLVSELLRIGKVRGSRMTMRESVIWEELSDVCRDSSYPSYEYVGSDPDKAMRIRHLLGEVIRRSINFAPSMVEMVCKVCYNLLTSSVPPSIHTFNTLIAGFHRIQQPELAQAVIDTYVYKTAWPATEQTMVCILNHYRSQKSLSGMRDIIQRMKGTRDTGLNFRILSKHREFPERWQEWTKESCASRKHSFVQRAHRTPMVFEYVIKGWLAAGQTGNASMAFVASLRSGNFISNETLHELLRECLAKADILSARKIMRGIGRYWKHFAAMMDSIARNSSSVTSRRLVGSFDHLADLSRLSYKDTFGSITKTYDVTAQNVKSFCFRIRTQLDMREIVKVYRCIVEGLNSEDLIMNPFSQAMINGGTIRQNQLQLPEVLTSFTKLSEIALMERRFHALQKRIRSLYVACMVLILKLKTGYTFPFSLSNCQTVTEQENHACLWNAFQQIHVPTGPVTQAEITSQLLRFLPNRRLGRKFRKSGNVENLDPSALATFYGSSEHLFVVRRATTYRDLRYYEPTARLERDVLDIEDKTKVLLFSHLGPEIQLGLRRRFPVWHKMSLEDLAQIFTEETIRERDAVQYLTRPTVEKLADDWNATTCAEEARATPRPATPELFKEILEGESFNPPRHANDGQTPRGSNLPVPRSITANVVSFEPPILDAVRQWA